MKKLIFLAISILIVSCSDEETSYYYPIEGALSVERGSDQSVGTPVLVAESHNLNDYTLDTIVDYKGDNTRGKLTFRIDLRNLISDLNPESYNGTGTSSICMSNSFLDGNFNNVSPVFKADSAKKYRVRFRLKGSLTLTHYVWDIDYIYLQLAKTFAPYVLQEEANVLMCKANSAFVTFFKSSPSNSTRSAASFDVTYDKYDLSFSELYFNLFINLTGQDNSETVTLNILKDSYFEIYEIN